MTLAVLHASPDNALDSTDAARLVDDLIAALGAAGATVVDRVIGSTGDMTAHLAEVARGAHRTGDMVLICADNLVAHESLLWTLATEPAGRSTALVVPHPGGTLRDDRGRLVAAGNGDGTAAYLGAIAIAPADLPLLVKAAELLHSRTRVSLSDEETVPLARNYLFGTPGNEETVPLTRDSLGPGYGGPGYGGPGYGQDATVALNKNTLNKNPSRRGLDPDDLLAALLEVGLVPIATPTRLLHGELVSTSAILPSALRTVRGIDEDAARLRMAVKEKDDFFTTYAVSSWSPTVTKLAARLGLTPTAVTSLSVLFAVAAALCFWQASRVALIGGGILLYLGFVLDCVDGQLARYTRRFDAFGGWLDTMADRAKEYAVYAGLAAGAERTGLHGAWPLAITAILLQTVRHMTDTWYGALHDEAAARPQPQATAGVGARLSAASTRVQGNTGSAAYWLKRIVVFPIGERWALMSVLAMVFNGRVALAAVVTWGLLAFGYTLALRSLRSLSMRVGVLNTVDTLRHRDDSLVTQTILGRFTRTPLAAAGVGVVASFALVVALLAGWLDPPAKLALAITALLALVAGTAARTEHGGPLDWLIPAGLRAVEYLMVVAAGISGHVTPPVIFLLLFALALRHYDLTARMEKGAPQVTRSRTLIGWDGRVVLLTLAALFGFAAFGEFALAVLVGGGFLVTAVRGWRKA